MFHVEPEIKRPGITCPVCSSTSLHKSFSCKDHFLTGEVFDLYQCQHCGHRITFPAPSEERIGRYYQSKEYLSHTDEGIDLASRLYRFIRTFAIRGKYRIVSRLTSPGKILDIGCGTGHVLHHFTKKGWEVQGIEPDERARNYAVQVLSLPVSDEHAITGFLLKSFDVITMWHVLEHVHDIEKRMLEVHRCLKDEGIAYVALPNPDALDAAVYGEYWAAWDVPRHLHHFTKEAFTTLAVRCGFEVKRILPMKYDAFYVSLLSEQYLNKRKRYAKAFIQGVRSNIKARFTGNYSSLVYVLRKK
jgi:2-polyprenyl-3-methyl-5-hydroxy-6-metoxy-1,4-benzoquinol methylase